MDKELWIKVREDFIEKNEREPTDSEMQELFARACGDAIDRGMTEVNK